MTSSQLQFSKLISKIPYNFLKLFFHILVLILANFCRKRKPFISGFKNMMEPEKSEKLSLS